MSLGVQIFRPLRSQRSESCGALAHQLPNVLGVLLEPDASIRGHLGDGGIDRLVLFEHAVGCNHDAGAVLAGAAMYVYRLRLAPRYGYELRHVAIETTWRQHDIRLPFADSKVFDPEGLGYAGPCIAEGLAIAVRKFQVDDRSNASIDELGGRDSVGLCAAPQDVLADHARIRDPGGKRIGACIRSSKRGGASQEKRGGSNVAGNGAGLAHLELG